MVEAEDFTKSGRRYASEDVERKREEKGKDGDERVERGQEISR